jgi:hypothetical protein
VIKENIECYLIRTYFTNLLSGKVAQMINLSVIGLYTALVSVLLMMPVHTQIDDSDDPLKGNRNLIDESKLALLWSDWQGDASDIHYSLFELISFGNPAIDDSLKETSRDAIGGDFQTGGDKARDIVAGRFTGGDIDDVVMIWEGANRSIMMAVPGIDADNIVWTDPNVFELKPEGTLADNVHTRRQMRIVKGQFTEDEREELLLTWWDADGAIKMEIFNLDANGISGTPVVQHTSVTLPLGVENTVTRSGYYDIAAGRFDGGDTDMIVLATAEKVACDFGSGCWDVVARIYRLNGNTLQFVDQASFFSKMDNSNRWLGNIAVAAGDFTGMGYDQIYVGYHVPHEGSTHRWYLQGLWLENNVLQVNPADGGQVDGTIGSRGYPLTLIGADLNLDGRDELVYAGRTLQIFRADSLLRYNQISGGSLGTEPNNYSRHTLIVADLDGGSAMWRENPDQRPEIAYIRNLTVSDDGGINQDGIFELNVLRFTPGQFNLQTVATMRYDRVDNSSTRIPLLVAGNFGDRGVRVDKPNFYRRTDIVQPLVILNAPPTHFDVFGESVFDVTGCYTGNCGFSATYFKEVQKSFEMSAEIRGDWQVGAGIEAGISNILGDVPVAGEIVDDVAGALGFGLDFSLEASYGEGFSKIMGSERILRVEQEIETLKDDVVYATIMDYDIWEYPLYVRGRFAGNIIIVLPGLKQNAWFPAKSPEGLAHRPFHEVGNILSYPRITGPEDNKRLVESLRWSTGDRVTLGSQSSSWSISQQNNTFSETSSYTHMSIGGDLDISLPIPTVSINLNGDYSEETVNTHRTAVSDLEGLIVRFGSINTSMEGSESFYSVTPYVYWDRSGALVLDYAVQPSVSDIGGVPTWWQERYGIYPDLAFNLPWRNDAAKTGTPVTELKRTETKNIAINPQNVNPGDDVWITALVQNYSLMPSSDPVPVRFFAGDPDNGGIQITGINGNPDPQVEPLAARSSSTVSTHWTAPQDFNESFIRIYAVIDSENTVTEIHENNNKGWSVLRIGSATSVDDNYYVDTEIPSVFSLEQNYPNPFNPSTRIRFKISDLANVTLIVYDILGRKVATLVDDVLPAGEYSQIFDAGYLASGVYLYQLRAGEYVETKRLMIVK